MLFAILCLWIYEFLNFLTGIWIPKVIGRVHLQTILKASATAVANAMYPIQNFVTIILALTITVIIFSDKGTALYTLPCKKCVTREECDEEPPQLCVFGENRNICQRRVCSKGPGEKCGDRYNMLGVCGEGLWCSSKDNRCHGCYIPTMTCFTGEADE